MRILSDLIAACLGLLLAALIALVLWSFAFGRADDDERP